MQIWYFAIFHHNYKVRQDAKVRFTLILKDVKMQRLELEAMNHGSGIK
jgi:hypothetical protein